MSIFAGALSDKWNKKAIMLISDSFAALCTIVALVLLQTGRLEIWHLFILNALNGSIVATMLPEPKNRIRVICNTLLISMSTENFFLAFGKSLPVWCIGAVLGWILIPTMSANLDVVFRNNIPIDMQGRVYAARNTFQFFTIPIGYIFGGLMVDKVFEPFMASQNTNSLLTHIFGSGKGSGAAFFFFFLWILGVFTSLIFRKNKYIWQLENKGSIINVGVVLTFYFTPTCFYIFGCWGFTGFTVFTYCCFIIFVHIIFYRNSFN